MRVILLAIAIACFAGMAYHAFPAVNPKQPLTSTQTSKDAETAKPRCIQATTVQRFAVTKSGAMTEIAKVTMWQAC